MASINNRSGGAFSHTRSHFCFGIIKYIYSHTWWHLWYLVLKMSTTLARFLAWIMIPMFLFLLLLLLLLMLHAHSMPIRYGHNTHGNLHCKCVSMSFVRGISQWEALTGLWCVHTAYSLHILYILILCTTIANVLTLKRFFWVWTYAFYGNYKNGLLIVSIWEISND